MQFAKLSEDQIKDHGTVVFWFDNKSEVWRGPKRDESHSKMASHIFGH